MNDLLALLREEACTLPDSEVPTTEETRPLLGALIKNLSALLADPDVDEPDPAPELSELKVDEPPASAPTPSAPRGAEGPRPTVPAKPRASRAGKGAGRS